MISRGLALIVAASAVALVPGESVGAEPVGGQGRSASVDLAVALQALARRAHVSILFRPETVAGRKASAVEAKGADPAVAMAAMLRGTGLRARRIAAHTYVIERNEPPPRQDAADGIVPSVAIPVAQQAPPPSIVVTALRRPTLLLDTPLSMVVIDGEEWRDLGGRTNADIARLAPSLATAPAGAGLDRLSMRGVFSAGEPSVGLYYGAMPVSGPSGSTSDPGMMTPNLVLADIDRIEVLRGPQGTLYGAGSLAGTVRVLFRQPDPDNAGGSIDGAWSSTKGGGDGFDGQAVANLVLAPGRLALRAVAYRRREAGFVDNTALALPDIGRRDDLGGRLSLKWQADGDWSLLVESAWQRTRIDDFGSESLDSGRDRTGRLVRLPFSSRFAMVSAVLRGSLGLGDVEFSASHYGWRPRRSFDFTHVLGRQRGDAGACAGYFGRSGPDCSSEELARFDSYLDDVTPAMLDQPLRVSGTTLEARLSGNGDINWTAGLFYNLRTDGGDSRAYRVDASGEPERDDGRTSGLISWRRFDGRLRQFAGFADLTWHARTGLDLTAGARFYSYRRSAEGISLVRSPATEAPAGTGSMGGGYSASGIVGRARADFHATANWLVYAEAAQGFRPGGINVVPGLDRDAVIYRGDRIASAEVGSRLNLARDRVQLSGTLFRQAWHDMQGSALTNNGAFSIITNLGAARIDGAEFALDTRMGSWLHARLQATWIDARLTADQVSDIAQASGRKGDPIPYVAPLIFAGSLRGEWPVGARCRFFAIVSGQYTGSYRSLADRSDPRAMRVGGTGAIDLAGRLEIDRFSLALKLDNLTDARGRSWATDTVFLPRSALRTTPRTVSLGFGATF